MEQLLFYPPLAKGTVKGTLLGWRSFMKSANAKNFRSELKEYMDAAVTEPVRISRRDGQSFILMSEQTYDDFRNEIQSLQRRLLGMSEILDGKTKPFVRGENRSERFKRK